VDHQNISITIFGYRYAVPYCILSGQEVSGGEVVVAGYRFVHDRQAFSFVMSNGPRLVTSQIHRLHTETMCRLNLGAYATWNILTQCDASCIDAFLCIPDEVHLRVL